MAYRAAMDIGGTFTDAVVYDDQAHTYWSGKASTTPGELARGALDALGQRVDSLGNVGFLVHGTTQGLNAFLTRRGARVLLLTSAGVGHVYHIARGDRLRLYDVHYRKPKPLIALRDVVEIGGRLDAGGAEIEPLDGEAVRAAARRALQEGYAAVAVAFLFSYANPDHELRARELITEVAQDQLAVSLSHEAARQWREYERTSSAVVDAYTGPVVRDYLITLEQQLHDGGLRVPLHIMQSNGGLLTAESARRRPLQTLLSGPVGGAMGCVRLAADLDRKDLIGIDMGGTSFDVSLTIHGHADVAPEATLEGLPMLMPVVNIHTIGAGGGSIAWTEAGGLRVGPRSATAVPGPACYGRGGTEPTVTDANLVLGRIDSSWFAGGSMILDTSAAERAITGLGDRLGLTTQAMAEGICAVANAKMAQAIRSITVSRGIEPRDFSLVAFGGAGPMHAAFLAQELGITEVIVPRHPGAFSAWGMLQTDVRRDMIETFFALDEDVDTEELAGKLEAMGNQALAALHEEQVDERLGTIHYALDVRYAEQEYTLTVPLAGAGEPRETDFLKILGDRFATQHQARYGHSNLGAPIEIVTLRATVLADLGRPDSETLPARAGTQRAEDQQQLVIFDGQQLSTSIIRRAALAPGDLLQGPAVIVEETATTVVPPGFSVVVHPSGALIMTRHNPGGDQ